MPDPHSEYKVRAMNRPSTNPTDLRSFQATPPRGRPPSTWHRRRWIPPSSLCIPIMATAATTSLLTASLLMVAHYTM